MEDVMYVDISDIPFKDPSDNKVSVLIATSEKVVEVEPNSAEENKFWRNFSTSGIISREEAEKMAFARGLFRTPV